ncbi:MAG: septum formation initiator family protein [Muribaculaceae bacterium]|nr:septum formation initiator family protein [Muribaculaceae bacterium]
MRSFLIWCHKYLSIPTLLIVGFIVYILFFQENSIGRIYDNDRAIDSLKRAIAVENDTLAFYRDKNMRLDNHDPEMIEKVVREQHNMSMSTEEVFVFK